jgi:predicted membrane chloride channel (bestrophin family)
MDAPATLHEICKLYALICGAYVALDIYRSRGRVEAKFVVLIACTFFAVERLLSMAGKYENPFLAWSLLALTAVSSTLAVLLASKLAKHAQHQSDTAHPDD